MRSPRFEMLILVLVALLSAWRLWRSPWSASNLEVGPDSIEYAVAADRFVTHHGYNLLIDGVTRPPRYPPWFSVGLLAPVLVFAPGELGAAVLPVFALGVLSVLTAFAIGKRLAGSWAAAGAAMALLLNPAFAGLSRVVMTEVPSLAFGLAGCWLYLGGVTPPAPARGERTEARPREALLAGLLTAAGFALRSECLAMLLPFGWRILARERRPAAALALLAFPSIVVAAATGWYNAATFSSFFRSGYHYWCPVPYDFPGMTFGLRYVPQNLARLMTPSRVAVLALGAAGAGVLLAQGRGTVRRALTYIALAAVPGSLLHLVYFYPEARFHIFVLALASILGGAGLGSLAGWAVRGRLWPIPLVLALAAFVPPREGSPPPHLRIAAETIARETPSDAVVVSGIDPVFLEPYLVRDASRTIVPASRSIEYASKLVAPERIGAIDPPPRGPTDQRAPGLLRAGAIEPFPVVATESREKLASWVREGKRVFIDASSLPDDAPLGRILDPSLYVVPNPRVPWLGELRARDSSAEPR
jgi:4-amino-4-deoxy-L-arabinose transferase-like glycosyltransferase